MAFNDDEQQLCVSLFSSWLDAYESNGKQFPVKFDDAWQLIGYSRKENAKRMVTKRFAEGIDYTIEKVGIGGSAIDNIELTIDTFKHMCLLMKNERGDAIRKYFISIEKDFLNRISQTLKKIKICEFSQLLEIPISNKNLIECKISDKLSNYINGSREIKCQCGVIDIKTDEYVIEVKCFKNWKHGLGQVIAYAAVTGLKPWLHLFDCLYIPPYINDICKLYNVKYTYE